MAPKQCIPIVGHKDPLFVVRLPGNEIIELPEPREDASADQLFDLGSVGFYAMLVARKPTPRGADVLRRVVDAYCQKWGVIFTADGKGA